MIRPIDLQNTILQSMQGGGQRTEDVTRLAAQASQAAFVNDLTDREESVAATSEASGSKIGDKPENQPDLGQRGRKRRSSDEGGTFEEIVDDAAAAASDAPHLIDFSA